MLTVLKTMLLAWIKALTPCSHEWKKVHHEEYEISSIHSGYVLGTLVKIAHQCPKCLKTKITTVRT